MSDDTAEEIKRRKLAELQQRAAGAPERPIDIEDRAHLERVLEDHRVVLVDCFAEWCGPCHQLKPILARLASETPAAVATVDIDEHRDLAREWTVRSVPTLLLYVDGELSERLMGVQPFDRLQALVEGATRDE